MMTIYIALLSGENEISARGYKRLEIEVLGTHEEGDELVVWFHSRGRVTEGGSGRVLEDRKPPVYSFREVDTEDAVDWGTVTGIAVSREATGPLRYRSTILPLVTDPKFGLSISLPPLVPFVVCR